MLKNNKTMISNSRTIKKWFQKSRKNFKTKETIKNTSNYSTKLAYNSLNATTLKNTTIFSLNLRNKRFNLRKGLSKLKHITIKLSANSREGSRELTNI